MSWSPSLDERLTRQERQLRTLETQVRVLIQGMNELSLRQRTAQEAVEQITSRPQSQAQSPRAGALGLLPAFQPMDGQLLERVAVLEAEVRALSEESRRPHHHDDHPPVLHGSRGEPAPFDGHHDHRLRDQHGRHHPHDHHQHGANKHDEHAEDAKPIEPDEERKADALVPPGVLTAFRLDAGDMYEVNESVWDGSLFVGIAPLGTPISVMMAVMFVLNIVVQTAFVWIAWNFMVEPEVGTDTLEGLLRFRVGMAHSVEYADAVLRRSMVAQICDEEDKLHMSAMQRSIYSDSLGFSSGGPLLSLLAQLCWLGSMFREVNAAYSFTRSVLQVPRGQGTEVITADSTADGLQDIQQLRKEKTSRVGLPSGSLVALTVVTRLTTLSRARLVWAVFGIALPRILLALTVGYVGVLFLATSAEMSDLVLNAIALAFIIDMDELLYGLFAPRRLHTLMNNIEPLPMPPLRTFVPGVNCLLKMLLVGTGVLLIQIFLLGPVFWRLRQAQDILCSGVTDFVYATNPATGMVHVARSAQPQGWSQTERTLLQVAHPELESKYGFDPGQELLGLAASDFSTAVVTTVNSSADNPVTIEAAQFDPFYFEIISSMGSWTAGEMSVLLPCNDRQAGNSYAQVDWFLEQLTGIPGFTCSALSEADMEGVLTRTFFDRSELCSEESMVNLRALCPESCGCNLGMAGMTGLFGTGDFGCPQTCSDFQTFYGQYTYSLFKYSSYTKYYYNYYSDSGAGNSSKSKGSQKGVCQDALDVELIGDPSASLACLANFSRCLEMKGPPGATTSGQVGRFTRWYATYVRGILPYMMGVWGAGARLEDMAAKMNLLGYLPYQSLESFLTGFWAGALPSALLNGTWTLADPQAPHPRGLTGCRFLASWELSALLGFNLCSPSGALTSIRGACPVACGCTTGMTECPAACTEVDYGDNATGDVDTDVTSTDTTTAATTTATSSAATTTVTSSATTTVTSTTD